MLRKRLRPTTKFAMSTCGELCDLVIEWKSASLPFNRGEPEQQLLYEEVKTLARNSVSNHLETCEECRVTLTSRAWPTQRSGTRTYDDSPIHQVESGEGARHPRNPKCKSCGSERTYRRKRDGFLQEMVMPMLGFFPWECNSCWKVFFSRNRGHRPPKRQER